MTLIFSHAFHDRLLGGITHALANQDDSARSGSFGSWATFLLCKCPALPGDDMVGFTGREDVVRTPQSYINIEHRRMLV